MLIASERIVELELDLPPVPEASGTYLPWVEVNGVLYHSGTGPVLPDKSMMVGKVGGAVDEKYGVLAARQVGLTMLAILKETGMLDRIKRVVKVLGMVNATPDFLSHPFVINGFSDLLVEVWGDMGRHARSAVGMGSLPGNISVEVEAIFQLKD